MPRCPLVLNLARTKRAALRAVEQERGAQFLKLSPYSLDFSAWTVSLQGILNKERS